MLPPIETNCLVWAAETFRSEPPADVDFWHIATFRCAAEFGRYRANKVSTQSSKACRLLRANSDPFCQCAHLADRAFLQGFARDGIGLVAALGKIPRHGLSLDWHGAYSPRLRILKNRGVGQKSIDPAAQQQLPQGFRAFQLQANVEFCAFSGRGVLDQLARPIVLAGHDQRNVPEAADFEAALLQARIIGATDKVKRLGKKQRVLEQRVGRGIGNDGKTEFAAPELTQHVRCPALEQAEVYFRI